MSLVTGLLSNSLLVTLIFQVKELGIRSPT